LLNNFERNLTWNDWEIGAHGIQIRLDMDDKIFSGTFLPQVASDYGWDHKETIDHLLKKAGYYGRISTSVRDQIELTRYQSDKAFATFDEYFRK
jgi:AMMECR1 domain-containing protein